MICCSWLAELCCCSLLVGVRNVLIAVAKEIAAAVNLRTGAKHESL